MQQDTTSKLTTFYPPIILARAIEGQPGKDQAYQRGIDGKIGFRLADGTDSDGVYNTHPVQVEQGAIYAFILIQESANIWKGQLIGKLEAVG